MDTYLRGRRMPAKPDFGQPSIEVLQLIRKLRWMGMEDEAERVQSKLRDTASTGGVITAPRETD
jgi:hypothetical protein